MEISFWLVKPTGYEMPGDRFKFHRVFFITYTCDHFGAAWMKAAALRRVDQTRRLTRGNFLEGIRVAGVRVGGGGEQGHGVGMLSGKHAG